MMQSKSVMLIIIAGMLTGMLSCAGTLNNHAAESKKKLMVHYMPWYVSRPFSGYWGWHWTMNHYNPDKVEANGRRSIASHYYPLIGPYDSNDADALECHVLLMKFAGIDGIIIDWYGIEDFYDYAIINRNTQRIIEYGKKAGLIFAICYEDQSIKHIISGGHLVETEAVHHGQAAMRWLQEHCFSSQAYLKVDNRPALFVFGPQYFTGSQWNQLFSVLPQRPFFYTLSNSLEGADGEFGWPPMHGTTTSPEQWRGYLANLYAGNKNGKTCVGAVFPQFHDIYESAEVHESYGFLDAQGVKTFEETFDMALSSNCELIQLVTWNDYGEGTMIEPTVEFGYRYLEIIQQRRKQEQGRLFSYSVEDLRLPVALYQLKKKHKDDRLVMEALSKCSEQLFSGNLADSRSLLTQYQSGLRQ